MPEGPAVLQATPAAKFTDRIATLLVWLAAILLVGVFLALISDLVSGGIARLSWGFLSEPPLDAGRGGGIAPIMVSTALILLIATAASVPPALATAVLLAEFSRQDSRFARFVRLSLDMLAGVPSIVFGLFGNAFFCIALGLGFSILSGGLTLACMMLPILIRTAEEGLRSAPDEYRLAAAALGLSRSAALRHLLLPSAMPALIAGWMLGLGRAAAETAALIFTSGYVDRMPDSLFDSGRALSVHIYDLAMNVAGGDPHARAAALVLILFLLAINGTSMALAGRWRERRFLTQ
ncbi:MAG: phosphate ABC transporter permease PstA [Gammaproteobacteria bacterium]